MSEQNLNDLFKDVHDKNPDLAAQALLESNAPPLDVVIQGGKQAVNLHHLPSQSVQAPLREKLMAAKATFCK